MTFNETFRAGNESRARYRLFCGGAGSGKSYNAAQDFILKLSDRKYRGANLLVVRKTETACRNSVFEELCGAVRRIFGSRADAFWETRSNPLELFCTVTGARIVFRGMNDEAQRERVKSIAFASGKLVWIWCEEATELEAADLEILDDRLRGDLTAVNPELYYQITMTFNPISCRHWIKRRFYDVPPSADVYRHHSTYRDNRFIDPDYAARMERRAKEDPQGYAVYALGEWGSGGTGRILTRWRAENLPKEAERYDARWLAQDFGFHHANCLLQVAVRDGTLYVLRELYVYGKDTEEIIALAERAGFPKDEPMYCDSAEPDRIRTWKRAGFRALPVKKGGGSVREQIEFLRGTEIVIDGSCENTLDEIGSWSYLKDENGEETDDPVPVHDDAMAALRYATEPLRKGMRKSVSKGELGL